MDNDKMAELLIEEVRLNRKEIAALRQEVWTLKTRFMLIAVTMGIAGGKLSSILPFLR